MANNAIIHNTNKWWQFFLVWTWRGSHPPTPPRKEWMGAGFYLVHFRAVRRRTAISVFQAVFRVDYQLLTSCISNWIEKMGKMRNDKVYKIIIKLSVSERKRERDSLLQQNKLHQLFTKSTGHSTTQMKKKNGFNPYYPHSFLSKFMPQLSSI